MKLVRYSGSNDWSALYIDGELDRVGDHYLIDERISALTGVVEVSSDAFLLGGNYADGTARTLDEITEYVDAEAEKSQRSKAVEEAAKLLGLDSAALADAIEKANL